MSHRVLHILCLQNLLQILGLNNSPNEQKRMRNVVNTKVKPQLSVAWKASILFLSLLDFYMQPNY